MGSSPTIAGILSVLPGLGHMYLGEFKKGIAMWLFGGALTLTGIGITLFPVYILYAIIDAVKTAKDMS